MTTLEQIYKLLKNPEKEKLRVEFKRSSILRQGNDQRKLACEIVAFANRHGGKLLIGINDNATFEGKNIFDIDRDKSILDNICHTKISPSIDYTTEYLEFDEGDVLLVNIQKRKGIPHAFIVTRESSEIKNRIYYIRTEYGIRLVNDIQLDWLFKNQDDPKIYFPFQIVVNLLSPNLGIPPKLPYPKNTFNFGAIIHQLPDTEKKQLSNNTSDLSAFIIQVCPYALLHAFSHYFEKSWLIQIQRRKNKIYWQSAQNDEQIKKFSFHDLPPSINKSLPLEKKWDIVDILRKMRSAHICLPSETEIKIEFNNHTSQLFFIHPDFKFNFFFAASSAGGGLFSEHPFSSGNNSIKVGQLRFVELECSFIGTFEFPENDIEMLQYYYHFGETIQDILKNEWDFNTFIAKYPPREIYGIDKKVTDVLEIIREKNQI